LACAHRAPALGSEDVRSGRLLTLQTAQGTDVVTLDWMHAWCASLTPADMQAAGIEFDLVPLQIADFRGPKTMSVSQQDHGCIAMPVLDLRAAAISFSTSGPVRYSWVRSTEEFAMVGVAAPSTKKAMDFPHPRVCDWGRMIHFFLSA
jgi:hypothetical protein